ncbi:MAG: phosphodiesterase, partial [Planctomycetaceae bacterium]
LKGIPTWARFDRVLEFIESRYPHADALIITGDLAHDERHETYQRLRERLGSWVPRVRLLPGNHDLREAIATVFPEFILPGRQTIGFELQLDHWQLLGLDSQVTGKSHGWIDDEQLSWLNRKLADDPTRPTMIFLHHPPVEVQSVWLDAIRLQNGDALREMLRDQPHVRSLFFGHIHQEFERQDETRGYYATPSTGVQFTPRAEVLTIDPVSPGFRVISLDEGRFETHVVRVGEP